MVNLPSLVAPGMFSRLNTLPLVTSCSVWNYYSSAKCNRDLWRALEHFGSSWDPDNLDSRGEWLPLAHQPEYEASTISTLPERLFRGCSLRAWATDCTLLASRDTAHPTEWQLVPVIHVLVAFVLEERNDPCQLASQLPR